MIILTSYNIYIGKKTIERVKTSVVGVIIAASTKISTMAWRRYLIIKSLLMRFILDNSQANIGISKSIPRQTESNIRVDIYDSKVIKFVIFSLT